MVTLVKNKSIESRVVIHKYADRIVLMHATQFKTKSNIRFKTIKCNEKTCNIEFNKMISKYQIKGYSLIQGIIPMNCTKYRAVELPEINHLHYVQALYPGIKCVIKKSSDLPVVYSESGSVLHVPTISMRASEVFKQLNIESIEAVISIFKPNSSTRFGAYKYSNQHILKNESDAELIIYDVCIPNLTFEKRRNMLFFIKGIEDVPNLHADAGIEVHSKYRMMDLHNEYISTGFTETYVVSEDNKYEFASLSKDKYMTSVETDTVIASIHQFETHESGSMTLYLSYNGETYTSVISSKEREMLLDENELFSNPYVEVKIEGSGFKIVNGNYEEL